MWRSQFEHAAFRRPSTKLVEPSRKTPAHRAWLHFIVFRSPFLLMPFVMDLMTFRRRLSATGFSGMFASLPGRASSASMAIPRSDPEIQAYIAKYIRERLHASELHPDAWGPVLIRDTGETRQKLAAVAGDKYSYRELDDFADLIARTLIGTPQASKYQRAGVW